MTEAQRLLAEAIWQQVVDETHDGRTS